MAKYNLIGYDNQILGQVEAVDAVDAWSKAREKFSKILDVRKVGEGEIVGWDEKPFEWYHPVTGKRLSVTGRMWENKFDDMIAAVKLTPEMIEGLREELEPKEYSGIIESGNIVVMAGDADGYHDVKAFPDIETALTEARKLVSKYTVYDAMHYYLGQNNYLELAHGGA